MIESGATNDFNAIDPQYSRTMTAGYGYRSGHSGAV